MNQSMKLVGMALIVGMLDAAHALPPTGIKIPKLGPQILSVPFLDLKCDSSDSICHVTVKVKPDNTGGCEASIDYDHVIVKKKYTPVTFELVRSSMVDGAVYEFSDQGIVFPPDLNPSANPFDSFEFLTLGSDRSTAFWRSLKKKKADLHYVPTVRRISPTAADCIAHDPKINNDGG